jgi:hypothetical protein
MLEIRPLISAALVLANAGRISVHVRRQGPVATIVAGRGLTILGSFFASRQHGSAAPVPGVPGGTEKKERKQP